jgi:OFA family oxalate/formate antiporter-like MFS transporter
MLAAVIVINLTMGFNYSWSVINKALVTDWHWTNVEAALPYTVYSVVYAISMFFAGRAQDKFGPRYVATFGSLVLAAGMLICSYAVSPFAMTIGYGLFVSTGFSTSYATSIPTSVKWFPPARKGVVTGVVVGSLGLAAVYMAPLADWILTVRGIPEVFLFWKVR